MCMVTIVFRYQLQSYEISSIPLFIGWRQGARETEEERVSAASMLATKVSIMNALKIKTIRARYSAPV